MPLSLEQRIKKADEIQNTMTSLIAKQEVYLSQFAEIIEAHEELKDSKRQLLEIKQSKQKLINELEYCDSLEFFLSKPYYYFEYNTTFKKMQDFMYKNYNYVFLSGYNPKTNIYALNIRIITSHKIEDILKELEPAINLAIEAHQTHFGIMTDDCSESGSLSLNITKNKYEIGKTVYGRYRVLGEFNNLKDAVKYILDEKLTYTQ